METFAWIGVVLAGALGTGWLIIWIIALLRDTLGRWILSILGILVVLIWGVGGAIYLCVEKA